MFFFFHLLLALSGKTIIKENDVDVFLSLASSSKIHIIRIIAIVIYNNHNNNIVTHHIIDGHAQTQRMAFKDTSCP